MKALVYQGPGCRAWEDRTKPTIMRATDAIVRITTTTICGTDLHILKGDLPTVTSGRILGHEGVGFVEELGTNVLSFHKGDKVLISCITSCGRCSFCRKGMYSQCRTGGWLFGNRIARRANAENAPLVSTEAGPVTVRVRRTYEELVIAGSVSASSALAEKKRIEP